MNFEPQSYIAKALIPIFLTALGTLAIQCARYTYFTYPREIRKLRESVQSEQKRAAVLQTYRISFLRAQNKALSSTTNRMKIYLDMTRTVPLRHDPNAVRSVHTRASAFANEASDEHGVLLAFPPEGKFVTQVERDALVEMAAAEVAVWETLYRCSSVGMTASEVSVCDNEIHYAEVSLSKTLAFVTGTKDSRGLNDSMIEIDWARNLQQYEARENEMLRWYTAATVGLFCSLTAFWLLIYKSPVSGVDLAQNAQAKPQSRRGYETGGKGSRIRNGRLGRISWLPTRQNSGRQRS